MDKNETEKKMLQEWAMQNNQKYYFTSIEKEKASYFMTCERELEKNPYLKEYGFEKAPEFINELEAIWGEDENLKQVKKTVTVAAMKNKISTMDSKKCNIEEDNSAITDNKDKLPMYIYNF